MTGSASTLPKVVPAEIDPGLWDLVDTKLAGSVLSWKRALGTKIDACPAFPRWQGASDKAECPGSRCHGPMGCNFPRRIQAEQGLALTIGLCSSSTVSSGQTTHAGVYARSLNPGLQVLVGRPGLD